MIPNMIYEKYHSVATLQKKVVLDSNFTYRKIIKLVRSISKAPKKILDIGCGVGTLDFYLASKGNFVTGVDISNNAVSRAKKNAIFLKLKNIKFTCKDIINFSNTETFDLVLCCEVIEHIEDDKRLIEKIYQLLNHHGMLILTTPLDSAPLYKFGFTRNFDKNVGHLRRYNLKTLQKLIIKSNLEINKVYYGEGAFRNTLFIFKFANFIVRLANKFYLISNILTYIDELSLKIFGPSNIYLIIRKK